MKKIVFISLALLILNAFTAKSQNTWEQITPVCDTCPPPLKGHTMVSFVDKVYLFGGMNNSKPIFNHVTVHDTQQQWSDDDVTNTPPPPRYGHTAVSKYDKMIVFYGKGISGVLDDMWQYDINTHEWSVLVPLSTTNPQGRYNHSVTKTGDKVWIFGGRDNAGNLLNDLWAYDLTTNHWTAYPSLAQTGLAEHVSVNNGTDIFVFLGYDVNYMNTEIYKFNTGSNTWSSLSPAGTQPYPVAGSACVQVDNNTAYIFGGSTGATSLDACYKWNISTHTFTQVASGPEVSYGAAALINSQSGSKPTEYKKIVFYGGEFEGSISDETWVYTTDIEATSGIIDVENVYINTYPNPTNNFITIEISEGGLQSHSLIYKLCDITGRIIKSAPLVSNKNIIDISAISKGIYFVNVLQGDSLLYVFKHVKE